jgi:hypothetical protein
MIHEMTIKTFFKAVDSLRVSSGGDCETGAAYKVPEMVSGPLHLRSQLQPQGSNDWHWSLVI